MAKESFFIFISQISVALCGTIVAILTARFLEPEGRGIYAFLQGLIVILLAFGGMGMGNANTYFISRKRYLSPILFWNSLFVGLIVGIISIGAIGFLYSFFPVPFKAINPLFILLVVLTSPFPLIGGFFLGLLLGMQRIFQYALVAIISGFINLLLFLIFLPVFPKIETAVFILIFISFLGFITPVIFLPKSSFSKPKIDLSVILESIKFGIKSQLGYIIQSLDYKLGIFLINIFLNPAAVGIFSIALFAGTSLKFFSDSIATVLFPKVSAMGNDFESNSLVCKSSRLSFAFTFFPAVFLIIFAYWIVKIFFGEAFLPGVMALRILALGMIFTAVSNVLRSYIIGRGFPQYYAFVSFVALLISLILSLFLIPKFGIDGSAIAASVSYFITFLASIYFYKKISATPFSLKILLIPTKQDFTVFYHSLHYLILKR